MQKRSLGSSTAMTHIAIQGAQDGKDGRLDGHVSEEQFRPPQAGGSGT